MFFSLNHLEVLYVFGLGRNVLNFDTIFSVITKVDRMENSRCLIH